MCFLEPLSFSSHSPETRRSDERNSKLPVGVNRSVNLSPFASTNWLVTDSRSVRHCFLSCVVWLNTVHAGGALTLHSSAGRPLWSCWVPPMSKHGFFFSCFQVSFFPIFGSPTKAPGTRNVGVIVLNSAF